MPDEQDFPDCERQCPQDASASPQSQAAQEAGLRIAKVTDHRDFDTWTTDEEFLQRFLMDKPAWRVAVQRYWRDRCTRRELASQLGIDLETAKNLLRRIRKAARNFQSGTITRGLSREDVQYPGRPHCGINAADIHAICDGDEDALAHMEEYGRLITIERLNMFAPAITGELVKVFDHSEAIGNSQREAITSGLVTRAETLKARAVRPDPFIDRPLFSIFLDQRTSMRIPDTENGITRWKARRIGRSEAEPIERGRPRKKPATTPKCRPRKRIPMSDLRVVPFSPPVSHGRSFYVA